MLYQRPGYIIYLRGEEVRWLKLCVAYIFLLFEHILKLKLVDPKKIEIASDLDSKERHPLDNNPASKPHV